MDKEKRHNMANFRPMNQIRPDTIDRLETGIDELDWLYGYTSTKIGNTIVTKYGLPHGKISLWSGMKGIGKSRACITLARSLISRNDAVAYFPLEQDASSFVANVQKDGKKMPAWFYVSEETSVTSQLEVIRETEPSIVFIDSINILDEFETGTEKNIKHIINIYREACKLLFLDGNYIPFSPHIIINSQLSKAGDPRGSSVLPHLVDIELIINKEKKDKDDFFTLKVGSKHRYGRTGEGMNSLWYHHDTCAECVSFNRLHDKKWCEVYPERAKIDRQQITRRIERDSLINLENTFTKFSNQLIEIKHPLANKSVQILTSLKRVISIHDTTLAQQIVLQFQDEYLQYENRPDTLQDKVVNWFHANL